MLHLHRYYWHDVKKVEHVPHLEVYIINLYPTVERNQIDPPKDADTIQDREIDIRFHDRTRYDVKVARMYFRLFDIAWPAEKSSNKMY